MTTNTNNNATPATTAQNKTAADYLATKDDGYPRTEDGRIYADAYDLIGEPTEAEMSR